MTTPTQALRRYLVTGAVPAVGAEFALTADRQGPWLVRDLAFTFVTSAAVGNRQIQLQATDGNVVYWRGQAFAAQATTLTVAYVAYPGVIPAATVAGVAPFPWPEDGIYLDKGWRLQTVTGGIDVGDQYSAIVALIDELPPDPHIYQLPPGPYGLQPVE